MDKEKMDAKLAGLIKAKGFKRYAQLLAGKFGGEAEQYKPALMACSLELAYILIETTLERIANEPSLRLGLAKAALANQRFQDTVVAAGEAVGIDWKSREAEYFNADGSEKAADA